MSDVTAERRATPRYPLILVVEVTEVATGTSLNARSVDLSRGGCYYRYVESRNQRRADSRPLSPGRRIF